MIDNKNLDFKLNREEISTFINLLLAKISDEVSINTRTNIIYKLTPNYISIKPGKHLNSQEINNTSAYDVCNFRIDEYINGLHNRFFWTTIGINSFKFELLGRSPLEKSNYFADNFQRDCFFYKYMYMIFGDNFILSTNNSLSEIMRNYLKNEHTRYLNNMKQAGADSQNGRRRKSNINRCYLYKKQAIFSYFQSRIDYLNDLLSNNIEI